MQIIQTGFEGLVEIIPSVFPDSRGWFFESFKEDVLKQHGVPHHFPQENRSFSHKNVVRGLHFQRAPHAQGKLVSVIAGRVLDVVVDLRKSSATFGKVFVKILDAKVNNMLYVPEGFAHGFSALEESIFSYKCTAMYHKASEGGIVWNDADLKIDWMVSEPIVSEKDQQLPSFRSLVGNL